MLKLKKIKTGFHLNSIKHVKLNLLPILVLVRQQNFLNWAIVHSNFFADDTKVYNKDTNSDILQQNLDALFVWSKLWQLCFNVDKCKTTHFGRNNQNYQHTMNYEDLDSVEEEKDLGVIFQQDLKFSNHIVTKVNKANSMLSLIVRTFQLMEIQSGIHIYGERLKA